MLFFTMPTAVHPLPFAQNSISYSDVEEGLGSADWVGEALFDAQSGHLLFEVSIAEPCDECQTEWRLGLTSDPNTTTPEILLSATEAEVWWETNMSWQYPVHFTDPIAIDDQSWFSQNGTTLHWSIPILDLPSSMWEGVSFGLYSLDDAGNDTFGAADGWSDVIVYDEDGDGFLAEDELLAGTDSSDADSDDDGIIDGLESVIGTDPTQCDTDGDTLPDGLEIGLNGAAVDTDTEAGCFLTDTQPSTTTDPLLFDTDGGGRSDGLEDTNKDGRFASWEGDPNDGSDDVDSDGDDIIDSLEADCPGGLSSDADSDGLLDIQESFANAGDTFFQDTDADGVPNFCDPDDDNDGIPTQVEGGGDTDGDGVINAHDEDSDGDGRSDTTEGTRDNDCDALPDFLDSDDEDGPCADSDHDGLYNDDEPDCGTDPYNPDTDGDGILDSEDCDNTSLGEWIPDEPKDAADQSSLGGGGCTAASGASWLFLVPLVMMWRRRSLPILLCLLVPTRATAVDVDPFLLAATPSFAQNYSPSSERKVHLFTGVLTANDQLQWMGEPQTVILLDHRLEQQSGIHVQWNKFAIGGVQPLHLRVTGTNIQQGDRWRLGNTVFYASVHHPFHRTVIGIRPQVHFAHTAEVSFLEDVSSSMGALLFINRTKNEWCSSANVSFHRLLSPDYFPDGSQKKDSLTVNIGLAYDLAWRLFTESQSTYYFGSLDHPFSSEWLMGVVLEDRTPLLVKAGFSIGLNNGIGTPSSRLFLSLHRQ